MMLFQEFYIRKILEGSHPTLEKMGIMGKEKATIKDILGVDPSNEEELKTAKSNWRKLMLKFNPNVGDNTDISVLLNAVAKILKRKEEKIKTPQPQPTTNQEEPIRYSGTGNVGTYMQPKTRPTTTRPTNTITPLNYGR